MATLVNRLRTLTSTVDDDFYVDSDLLTYLNQAKSDVISYYIQKERDRKRSLRVLDDLRTTQELSYSGNTYKQLFDFYKTSIQLPSNILSFLNVINNDTVPAREVTFDKQTQIRLGHLQPTPAEHYYTLRSDGGENGKIVFDLTELTYPYSVSHVALVSEGTTLYDGVSSDIEWADEQEAINSLIDNFEEPLLTQFPQFEFDVLGNTLIIQTINTTPDFNETPFEIYLRSNDQPEYTASYSNVSASTTGVTGTFSITLVAGGVTTTATSPAIDVSIANNNVSEFSLVVKQMLNGEQLSGSGDISYNTGGGTTPTRMLPSDLTAYINSFGYFEVKYNNTTTTAQTFDLTVDYSGLTFSGSGEELFNVTDTMKSSLEYTGLLDGGANPFKFVDMYVDTNVNDTLEVFYFKKPAILNINAESLLDMPTRVDHAVLYKAALLVSLEESQKNMDGTPKTWQELYVSELQNNEY